MSKPTKRIKRGRTVRALLTTKATCLATHATQLEWLARSNGPYIKNIGEAKALLEYLIIDGAVDAILTDNLSKIVSALKSEKDKYTLHKINMRACSVIVSYLAEGIISEDEADQRISALPWGLHKPLSFAEVIHLSEVAFEDEDDDDDEYDDD